MAAAQTVSLSLSLSLTHTHTHTHTHTRIQPSQFIPTFSPGKLRANAYNKNTSTGAPGSVQGPTLAQVMISQFVSSSPASGFVLTAQNLEPASDSVSPSLSAPPLLTLCVCVSLSLSQK